ncbi:hypothetical protein Pint_36578 [Pistacia integerrima]|uniref:Uncharacterized protein n=1 Tax=Pistacia integerrima TaxID=434235 RepID=A0ACC0Y2W1_9ROSI|nr:hypothetical protein Pint_36578 [Pistacia integerrima]
MGKKGTENCSAETQERRREEKEKRKKKQQKRKREGKERGINLLQFWLRRLDCLGIDFYQRTKTFRAWKIVGLSIQGDFVLVGLRECELL